MSDFELLHRRAWLMRAGLALLPGLAWGPSVSAANTLPRITPDAIPAPRQLRYDVRGTVAFLPLFADGDLTWRHGPGGYEARLRLDAGFLGTRERISAGTITPTGLQPLRYTDRAQHERDTEFDWPHAEARLARGGTAALDPGTQDLVSLYIQLACLFAMDAALPFLPPSGTQMPLPVLGNGKSVERWRLVIQGEETLALPGGPLRTRKLLRLPEASDNLGAELWLAPALNWMPARIRLREGRSSDVDLRWSQSITDLPSP
ncbi:DUF3108 domain-containing protein [Hylemonella gracilis]|uniref:DUF3108 domain-containing protein n=1 Tax=Hylemonella gracilis ATCC 19624 TaxID=887062 RepID=F3KWH1_9BURK|nr:DUF3108 domain-containing protein [Hylemonella gracilis]EGI75878.1 hypothetical protein HGR_14049 [Hylemonella gracilis ATCC 19624]